MEIDYQYLCTKIGDMAGVPIRLYEGESCSFFYSVIPLPKDPLLLYGASVTAVKGEVGYFVTPAFEYYGVLNAGWSRIVIGPTHDTGYTERDLSTMALRLELSPEERQQFMLAMKNIISLPLNSLLQILCSMNYIVNGTKLELSDIEITDAAQQQMSRSMSKGTVTAQAENRSEEDIARDLRKTYFVEQTLADLVRRGDREGFERWLGAAPTIRPGRVAEDPVRQEKNNMLIAAAVYARAAIRGGADPADALQLSNAYCMKIERMNRHEQLAELGVHMVRGFIELVEEVRAAGGGTELVRAVAAYTRRHISEPLTGDVLAAALGFSRSYLSTRFKKESGMNLNEYIHRLKLSEAKHQLAYTDRSLLLISTYLGYASQGHFCNVFKKYTGKAPGEYRAEHR